MKKTYDWSIGTKYRMLTIDSEIIYTIAASGRRIAKAWCQCECGTRKLITLSTLRTYPGGRDTISCGCYYRNERKRTITHGQSKTRLYAIYKGMLSRCYNENREAYQYYGGKGVTVCDLWRADFLEFKKWSEANGYQETLEIDRKDASGNYCPENCRWVTNSENTAHRNARYLTLAGETRRMQHWVDDEKCTVQRWTLRHRLKKGMSVEEAITTPHIRHKGLKNGNAKQITAFGEIKTLGEWVQDSRCNVSYSTLQNRLLKKWEPEQAITHRFRQPKSHLLGTHK